VKDLCGKTVFITGASRGIGKAIALRVAADGANVALAAKTVEPHAVLPGTIHSAADEVTAAGGNALPLAVDIRYEDLVETAVSRAVEVFGGIDVLVNNASAIQLTGTLDTSMKRFDLMWAVNARGTFTCSKACLPHLLRSSNPHILTLAPPPRLEAEWFAPHLAYTLSKYGMSLCVLGMAEEFRSNGVAVNALWPRTVIATAALRQLGDRVDPRRCRVPEIVAEAAHRIVIRDSGESTGRFFIDEEVLAADGVVDFSRYAIDPEADLAPDLFVDP
jgi:citronellol/citronellal dehydrogenase